MTLLNFNAPRDFFYKMIRLIIIFVLTLVFNSSIAQEAINVPQYLNLPLDSTSEQKFRKSLNDLFSDLYTGNINKALITPKRFNLTVSQLQVLINYEARKTDSAKELQDKFLINCYPVSSKDYIVKISYINQNQESQPIPVFAITLIATETNNNFTFSIPLDYLTRYWKTKIFGDITYHFRTEINEHLAKTFNHKNTEIAKKLGLKPQKFNFYLTDNYQEILGLLGFTYSLTSNGKYRDGYGVNANTIFAVMNNEDFSHDIFHYYSGQINKPKNRNWIAEEGIAYLWGNAYYTDTKGDMITQQQLVEELKKYLANNPDTSLFSLFKNDTKIFSHLAPEISVRSTISGIIANHIEQEKGTDGILKLINAGSKDRFNNYLKTTNQLIGLNEDNFDQKVRSFIK
ncbi:hypothetical protein [Psychroflexus sp. ALD_RP9]|uniref:hypothetical protein n=1 Tax=Psychroflexus sp. ALD_RP9 TaxID=2777186 RepID=UPI001A8FA6C0|nr:hypothetical protein [Psychroflexus sp. ALD_RP9]QSS97588.1 hypothetical protein IMZ30_02430 [Psychroflexus sp. ALD_RP9]